MGDPVTRVRPPQHVVPHDPVPADPPPLVMPPDPLPPPRPPQPEEEPGGERHLEVHRVGGQYRVKLVARGLVTGHCPSVDVFFHSLAHHVGKNATACLLTGMGADGADGLAAMRAAGAHTFAQDRATCAVWGMPAAAAERGAAERLVPLTDVPTTLLRALAG